MFRIYQIVLAAIVLVAILASGFITQRMYAHQQSLKEGSRYNVAWSVSQAVTEYTRLQLAIARAAQGGPPEEAALRHDICLNRVQLMSGGDVAAFLATDPRHGETLRAAEAALARVQPLLNRIGQPDIAREGYEILAPLTGKLAALAAVANRHGGERVARDEADLFALHWMFTGLAAALIGGGIALIVLLTRRMNELHATKTTLEQTAEHLTGALVRADAAGQAKATFLATMSHEIRTPLNAMLGLTTSLLDEVKSGPQRGLLETIRDAGDSLLRLLNDILDFSKLDAGRMTFEETPFSPGALSANAASILDPRAKAKGISLFVLAAPDLPSGLLGDPGRIEQIIINLVSNAVKFTERGHVTLQTIREPVAASQTPDKTTPDGATLDGATPDGAKPDGAAPEKATIVWRISDTGIGIPAGRVGALFSDFMQADHSITRRFGGTGLGLAISKRLIDDMNGTITVESTAGAGTVFTVRLTLPIVASPIAEGARASEVVPRFEALIRDLGRPLRILFVEDNPTNQYVATQLLKGYDVHLDMAGNGLEALDSVSRFTHDLICMDMRMPEMDGLEATRRIRQMGGRMATIPIIALTANAFKDDIDACFAAGMNRFVSKPVRRDVLLGAMLAELSRPDALPGQGMGALPGQGMGMVSGQGMGVSPGQGAGMVPGQGASFPGRRDTGASSPRGEGMESAAQGNESGGESEGGAARNRSGISAPLPAPDDLLEDFPLALPLKPRGKSRAARLSEPVTFDAVEFDGLIDMIGEEGVTEMIGIFETETRRRVQRLRGGDQDMTTISREMHTLKGAAGTVAAPRLFALGRGFEEAANQDIPPTREDIQAIEDALDDFLLAIHSRGQNRVAA